MRVGLTGGVGSGKSTVAARFAEHGALVIDADAIAREVLERGSDGLAAVVERFGADLLTADGNLDRPALATVVFADDDSRRALNAIVHPRVGERVATLVDEATDDAIVVYDVPLLVETNPTGEGFDLVVVVEAPLQTRLARLEGRGMAENDARARIATQATDDQRRAAADEVVANDGTLDELHRRVDAVWERIEAAATADRGGGGVRAPGAIG